MSTEQSTNSGEIEDLRDQIFLLKRRSLFFFILKRNASTKLPFHIDRRGMNEFLRFDSAPKASSYSSSFSFRIGSSLVLFT